MSQDATQKVSVVNAIIVDGMVLPVLCIAYGLQMSLLQSFCTLKLIGCSHNAMRDMLCRALNLLSQLTIRFVVQCCIKVNAIERHDLSVGHSTSLLTIPGLMGICKAGHTGDLCISSEPVRYPYLPAELTVRV